MSIIILSSKETCSKASEGKQMLKTFFFKLPKCSSIPWILVWHNKLSMSFNKPTSCAKFHQNHVDNCIYMTNEHSITHFSPPPQHLYNSPNLPVLLLLSSQGSVGLQCYSHCSSLSNILANKVCEKITAEDFCFLKHVTLSKGWVHSNWYQNVKFRSFYHHTTHEWNQLLNVWKEANTKGLFFFFSFSF